MAKEKNKKTKENLGLEAEEELSMCCDAPISDGDGDADGRCTSCGKVVRVEEVGPEDLLGEGSYPHLSNFEELYGIEDEDQYKDMADDAQSMDIDEFQDTYSSVIDMAGDFWEDHQDDQADMYRDAQRHGDFESTELDRIKELAGASIDETYDDDDEFYNAYGEMWYNEDDIMDEAEYQGRKVKLGKPMQGDVKKFKVYVKDPKTGNVKKVNFGHGGSSVKGKAMSIKKSNPARRRSFRARHNCDNPGPRTKARYWSCRKW